MFVLFCNRTVNSSFHSSFYSSPSIHHDECVCDHTISAHTHDDFHNCTINYYYCTVDACVTNVHCTLYRIVKFYREISSRIVNHSLGSGSGKEESFWLVCFGSFTTVHSKFCNFISFFFLTNNILSGCVITAITNLLRF